MRLVAYVGFALMLVILYYDIGNKASTVTHNATMFFSMCCICVFQTILPAVIVCESRHVRKNEILYSFARHSA